jgi:hypothetical protein
VICYLLSWGEDGELHAAHHCNAMTLDGEGRIARDAVRCGRRRGAQLLAEMGAAVHA